MKKLIYILILCLSFACDSESGSECLRIAGTEETKIYDLETFSKLIIHEGIELEIKQGSTNSIQISYGKNLIDEISAEIISDQLTITNKLGCDLIRDFEPAKVLLTAIDISEIRNASQFAVFSKEILRFNSLTLISENALEDFVNVGDFNLHLANENLTVISNNVSNFKLEGSTNNLFVGFYAGHGIFEGTNLLAENVTIFHRGANKMILNPQQILRGEIRGSGDVLSLNRPPEITVETYYTGRLIFSN